MVGDCKHGTNLGALCMIINKLYDILKSYQAEHHLLEDQ